MFRSSPSRSSLFLPSSWGVLVGDVPCFEAHKPTPPSCGSLCYHYLCHVMGTVRIPLVLRSDRPHRSTHQPLASGSHCLPFNSRHLLTASSSNSGARYRKRITPLPAFTASRLSPFTFHF